MNLALPGPTPTGRNLRILRLRCTSPDIATNDEKFNPQSASTKALAWALRDSRSAIHILDLNLSHNVIGDTGAEALAHLGVIRTLEKLKLNVGNANIGDSGATCLAALGHPDGSLRTLQLELFWNLITPKGAIGLSDLGLSRTLHTLRLNLEGNAIQNAGAEALSTLTSSDDSNLLVLELNLRDNFIGDAGACALAKLLKSSISGKRPSKLRICELDLQSNCIGDTGATALAEQLNTWSLDCIMSDVGPPLHDVKLLLQGNHEISDISTDQFRAVLRSVDYKETGRRSCIRRSCIIHIDDLAFDYCVEAFNFSCRDLVSAATRGHPGAYGI